MTTRGALRAAALALMLAGAWVVTSPAPALGQEGLPIVSHAHYEVLPDERRIHVTVDAVATSTTPNTATEIVSYVGTNIPLLPGATNPVAFGPTGAQLATQVLVAADDHTLVEVYFDQDVHYGQSYAFRLEFDLPDGGGDPRSPMRVSPTVVAFPVWAYGTPGTPGSSASVGVPDLFQVQVLAGDLTRSRRADGATLLTSATLADPIAFTAYITADRPGTLVETPITVRLGDETLAGTVAAWLEDPEWAAMVVAVTERGLPALHEAIGLPFPDASFRVTETAISRLGGYAGSYQPANSLINVAPDADAFVVLHELTHAWFNEELLRGRWINEAFASYYAERAQAQIGETGLLPELVLVDPEAALPLNAWNELARGNQPVEDYAYAATLEVGRLIGAVAGDEVLRDVWRAAADHLAAYQPVHRTGPERLKRTPPGWQLLLDHLTARGADAEGIWRDWVITQAQVALLTKRAEARAALEATVAAAADWELPRDIRDLMSAWRFDQALADLELARAVLAERDRIEAAATRIGMEPTGRLQAAFETEKGLERALAAAAEELAVLGELEATIEAAGDWELPDRIRDLISNWRFDQALAEMRLARVVLAQRERLETAAASAGLEPSDRLHAAFEGDTGLAGALAVAGEELAAVGEIEAATAEAERDRSWLEGIGMIGDDPSADLTEALDEFQAGDTGAARGLTEQAVTTWREAAARGEDRVTLGAAAAAGLMGLALVGASGAHSRRRPVRAGAHLVSVDRPEVAADGERQEGGDQHAADTEERDRDRSLAAATQEERTDRQQEAAREGP